MSRNNGIPIPTGLKKKLQANLENLSAREAGRLLLIYTQEADKKGIEWQEYPPTKELWAAFDRMVEKARGKPEEGKAVDRFNGLNFLARLINEIHRSSATLAFGISSDVHAATGNLRLLLYQMQAGDIARIVQAYIHENSPAPVTPEEFVLLKEFEDERFIENLSDATHELLDNHKDDYSDEEYDKQGSALYEKLEEALKTGELIGGEGWSSQNVYASWGAVLLEDGNIPGWLALRIAWRNWLETQGMTTDERASLYREEELYHLTPDTIYQVVGPEGDPLEYEVVVALVEKFYKAARRKAWGKKLNEKPDLARLVVTLLQDASIFLMATNPDFGPVDFQQFKKAEEPPGEDWQTDLYATSKSLTKKAADFGFDHRFTVDLVSQFYYPYHPINSMKTARFFRAASFSLLESIKGDYQGPPLRRKSENLSLTSLAGIKFGQPLEMNVKALQNMSNYLESFLEAYNTLSRRYFEGMPVLWGQLDSHYKRTRQLLDEATADYHERLEKLVSYMAIIEEGAIDTEPLRLAPPTVDPEIVEQVIEKIMSGVETKKPIEELLRD